MTEICLNVRDFGALGDGPMMRVPTLLVRSSRAIPSVDQGIRTVFPLISVSTGFSVRTLLFS